MLRPLINAIFTPPEQRTPYTRYNAVGWLLPFAAIAGAAHVRYRHPRLPTALRILYATVAIAATLHVRLAHFLAPSPDEDGRLIGDMAADMNGGIIAFLTAITILEFLFCRSEQDFDVRGAAEYRRWIAGHDAKTADGKKLLREDGKRTFERPLHFPGTLVPLELDVLWTPRCIGYGRGIEQSGVAYRSGYEAYIAAHELRKGTLQAARTIKWTAVRRALRVVAWCYLVIDVLESFLHHPAVMPTYKAYASVSVNDARHGVMGACGPWVLTVMTGVLLVCIVQLAPTMLYVVALTLTRAHDAPITIARWQPCVFAQPHRSTSVRALWGRHWHAYLRRTVVVAGYRPMQALASRLALPRRVARCLAVMAAFLVSGLCHELSLETTLPHQRYFRPEAFAATGTLRTPDRGFGACHFLTTRFFLAMGAAVCVEEAWSSLVEARVASVVRRDGKTKLVAGRARSVLGWTWCMAYMTYFGHDLVDLWLGHGMGISVLSAQLSRPLVNAVLNRL